MILLTDEVSFKPAFRIDQLIEIELVVLKPGEDGVKYDGCCFR